VRIELHVGQHDAQAVALAVGLISSAGGNAAAARELLLEAGIDLPRDTAVV
jgi:mevalonate pyrophosphate decarboxylase